MFGRNKDRDAKAAPAERPAAPAVPGAGGTAPSGGGRGGSAVSPGRLAYEARRAEKAGMGLEKWMAEKSRRVQQQREDAERARREAAAPAARPGLLRRLLDRAHKPL